MDREDVKGRALRTRRWLRSLTLGTGLSMYRPCGCTLGVGTLAAGRPPIQPSPLSTAPSSPSLPPSLCLPAPAGGHLLGVSPHAARRSIEHCAGNARVRAGRGGARGRPGQPNRCSQSGGVIPAGRRATRRHAQASKVNGMCHALQMALPPPPMRRGGGIRCMLQRPLAVEAQSCIIAVGVTNCCAWLQAAPCAGAAATSLCVTACSQPDPPCSA